MFTNIKVEKFWTGPVSKVAHTFRICAQLQAVTAVA